MDLKVSPHHLLVDYVWALLKANTTMVESHYGGRVPIAPASMEPAFTEVDKPFLIFGYAEGGSSVLYPVKTGSLTFTVYSTTTGEITAILNTLQTAFERQDEAAREVNDFTSSLPQYLGIRFGSLAISYLEGPSPEQTEGGRQSGIITIRYTYFANYNIVTNV